MKALQRALTPFGHAGYRRLALALVMSSFAGGAWLVGQVWEVIRIGGGPGQLSAVTAAGAIGVLVPALLGGVVADRVPQKRILSVVALVEFAAMGAIALLSLADLTQLWHLITAAALTGVGMAFYYPAYSAWLPALVPDEDLQAVNGFEGMVRPTIGQAIGPAVAGMVVAASAPGWAMAVAAFGSLAGLFALQRVPLTAVRRDQSTPTDQHPLRSALSDVAEGFRYMRHTPWLLATLLFASLLTLAAMGPLEVLIPFLIKDSLGGTASDHALVLAGFGIGGAVASLAMAAAPMPRRYLTFMNLVWAFSLLPFLVIANTDHIAVVIACGLIMGAAFSAPMVIWGTLLQRRVPPHLLGRVASLDFFVSISLMPLSMALAGPLSDLIGLRTTFVVAALVPPLVGVIAVVAAKLPQDEIANPLV